MNTVKRIYHTFANLVIGCLAYCLWSSAGGPKGNLAMGLLTIALVGAAVAWGRFDAQMEAEKQRKADEAEFDKRHQELHDAYDERLSSLSEMAVAAAEMGFISGYTHKTMQLPLQPGMLKKAAQHADFRDTFNRAYTRITGQPGPYAEAEPQVPLDDQDLTIPADLLLTAAKDDTGPNQAAE